jgi:hypothetical protein
MMVVHWLVAERVEVLFNLVKFTSNRESELFALRVMPWKHLRRVAWVSCGGCVCMVVGLLLI